MHVQISGSLKTVNDNTYKLFMYLRLCNLQCLFLVQELILPNSKEEKEKKS